jgi:hypothetical protein
MKARDHRPTLLKGIDTAPTPDKTKPETLLTPNWISPTHSGRLAAKLAGKDDLVPQRVPNRAERRANARAERREQKAAAAKFARRLAVKRERLAKAEKKAAKAA